MQECEFWCVLQFGRNQEELERWATAAKQKEDDSLALQKYTRADESKIRDVNLMIEQLTREQLKTKVHISPIFYWLLLDTVGYDDEIV